MKIGQVAQQADVSVDTVRFYERRGILPAAERRPSGYRVFSPAAVERIQMAKALQELGFTLDESSTRWPLTIGAEPPVTASGGGWKRSSTGWRPRSPCWPELGRRP